MRRFRIRRRRALAALLVPAAVITIGTTTSSAQETRQAAIEPAKQSVRFGAPVRLRGQFPGAPNTAVAIQYRAAGAKRFRQVATTRTNENSRWKARVKPHGTGMWRARLNAAPRTESTGDVLEGTAVDREATGKRVAVRSVTHVKAKHHVVIGHSARIEGRVRPGGRRRVIIKAGGKRIKTHANSHGRFDVSWKPGSTGTYKVKARARGNNEATGSGDRGGRVTVYRYASASWYGPGLYGNRTACGQTLSPSTLGVANKSMPCGSKLTLRYGHRSVRVEVIDRGPYVGDREFDLTEATRNRLGFGSTGQVLTSK
jgi:hypothetical protein